MEAEIKTKLNLIIGQMVGKGLKMPDAFLAVYSDKRNAVIFTWHSDSGAYEQDSVTNPSIMVALELAIEKIQKIPDREERNRAEYRKAVANAIDLGKKFGIEDAAINPLREVMEKLSKNALEYQPIARADNPLGANYHNDDMPF
jgi:hypothetical protein